MEKKKRLFTGKTHYDCPGAVELHRAQPGPDSASLAGHVTCQHETQWSVNKSGYCVYIYLCIHMHIYIVYVCVLVYVYECVYIYNI